jgi:acetylornithine deacetylase/succinyl-diaminopimelate desuccinylase-like protein
MSEGAAGTTPTRTDDVVALTQALIRNACVNDGTPDGGQEHRSVTTLADYFGRSGEIIEPHPGRQSVVYRVPGTVEGAPSLTLLPHLDVVPVTPSGWSRDPFGGEIADGFVWGRGAIDMLNLTASMAVVFRRYLEGTERPLPGDLIYAAVADEEAGGALGAGWIAEHRPDLLAGEYLLTEIATPHVAPGGGLPVTVAEKGPAWRVLRTSGTPGHGSQPYASDNALVPLAEAITLLASTPTPVVISEEWRQFVEGSGLPPDLVVRLTDPDRVDGAIDELREIDVGLARWAHACTHMTVAPTVLRSGAKHNVIPDGGEARIDVRITPGQDETTVDDHLRKVLGPALYDEIDVVPDTEFPATGSALEGPLWEAIGDAAEVTTGSRRRLPMLIPVTTDARFFRAAGTQAYGVGLFDGRMGFGEMLTLFHGHDERVSVASLHRTTELLAETIAAFGRRTT